MTDLNTMMWEQGLPYAPRRSRYFLSPKKEPAQFTNFLFVVSLLIFYFFFQIIWPFQFLGHIFFWKLRWRGSRFIPHSKNHPKWDSYISPRSSGFMGFHLFLQPMGQAIHRTPPSHGYPHPSMGFIKKSSQELRRRLRSFFLQNRHQALHVTRQRLRESMSPQLQSEVWLFWPTSKKPRQKKGPPGLGVLWTNVCYISMRFMVSIYKYFFQLL